VEEVFPELVTVGEAGYKAVDYGKLTAVLVEAIRAQSAEITSLQRRIAASERSADPTR
jgi:hypothetical protein